jgi:hypothetical protein
MGMIGDVINFLSPHFFLFIVGVFALTGVIVTFHITYEYPSKEKPRSILLANSVLIIFSVFGNWVTNSDWLLFGIFSALLILVAIFNVKFITSNFNQRKLIILLIPILCIGIELINPVETLSYFPGSSVYRKIFGDFNGIGEAKAKLDNLRSSSVDRSIVGEYFEEKGLIAFKYGPGFIDNWQAFVYDPTGVLDRGIEMIDKNPNGFYTSLDFTEIKWMFGGDMNGIVKLEEDWYFCSFT